LLTAFAAKSRYSTRMKASTFLAGFAVIVSFFPRVRAEAYLRAFGRRLSTVRATWEFIFYITVFLTILFAPLT
jgi:hypothetical protein